MTENEDWPWTDFGPTYSAPGRRRGLVQVPYGTPLPAVGAGYVGTVMLFAIGLGLCLTGILLWFQTVVIGDDPAGWWWLALVVPAGLVAVIWGSGTYAEGMERTMSAAATWRIIIAAAAGTVFIPTVVGLIRADRSTPVFAGFARAAEAEWFLLAGGVALTLLVVFVPLAIRTVRRARAEVVRIKRLRATGRRVPGMVLDLPDPKPWPSRADVSMRIEDPAGERVVRMRLNTAGSTQIPVRGTRLIILIGESGDLHVELDPEHPPVFLKNTRDYESSADGGS